MQQPQSSLKHAQNVAESSAGSGLVAVFARQSRLHQFHVPVAKLAPEEVVHPVGGFVEAVSFESFVYFRRYRIEARENPAVFQGGRLKSSNSFGGAGALARGLLKLLKRPHPCLLCPVHIHKNETGGVPDLVGKGAVALGALGIEG